LRDLKGAMRLDHSKDMSVHVSTCTSYDFNAVNTSFMEVTALIKRVFLCLVAKMNDQSLEERIGIKFLIKLGE